MESTSGLQFEVTAAVLEQIYNNSVFPAQGTRPVFSSGHGLLSSALVEFSLWAIEHGALLGQKLCIDVDVAAKQLLVRCQRQQHHHRGTIHRPSS
jgi:cell division protease FtsH